MTSERECYVYIMLPDTTEFVTAARLRIARTADGVPVGTFVYGRRYLERADAVELDPVELRLGSGAFETARMGGFFGAIRDAMPDWWGRRVIEKHSRRAGLEEFDYLLEGADDRAGALGFGLNVTPPAPQRRFNRTIDLARLQQQADAIVTNDTDSLPGSDDPVEDLLLIGTSMGGARPKAVVEHDGALWLAKFGRQDDAWNHPRTEHAMLELARRCGLATPDSRIVDVGGRDVLLIRRFDRDPGETGYRRRRMVSALTLLQAGDDTTERSRWSYILLADELRRVSAAPEEDLRALYTRMCFNAAISNTDDHPRNHALLAKDKTWRLSPAYDLTPTPQLATERRDLAMICGRQGRWANKANLVSEHGRFLLAKDEATAILDRIADIVAGEWLAELRRAGVNSADCSRLESAFVYDGLFHQP